MNMNSFYLYNKTKLKLFFCLLFQIYGQEKDVYQYYLEFLFTVQQGPL